ncbi:MAG: hypothetical protein RMJ16_13865 [Thermoguttaceae bacterium]|nr:hypothetical protein [Thermoguttaceae bacterium]
MKFLLHLNPAKIPFDLFSFPFWGICNKCKQNSMFLTFDFFVNTVVGYCFKCQKIIDLFQYIVYSIEEKELPLSDAIDYCLASGIIADLSEDDLENYYKKISLIFSYANLFSKIKSRVTKKDIIKTLDAAGLKSQNPELLLNIFFPVTQTTAQDLNLSKIISIQDVALTIPFYTSPGIVCGFYDITSSESGTYHKIFHLPADGFSSLPLLLMKDSLIDIRNWTFFIDNPRIYASLQINTLDKLGKFVPAVLFHRFFRYKQVRVYIDIPGSQKFIYLRSKPYSAQTILLCNIYNCQVLPIQQDEDLSFIKINRKLGKATSWIDDLIKERPPIELLRYANRMSRGKIYEYLVKEEKVISARNSYLLEELENPVGVVRFRGSAFIVRDHHLYNDTGLRVSSFIPILKAVIDDLYIVEVRSAYGNKTIVLDKYDFYTRLFEAILKAYPRAARREISQSRILRLVGPDLAFQLGNPEICRGIPSFNEEGLRLSTALIKWNGEIEERFRLPALYGPKEVAFPGKYKKALKPLASLIAKLIVLCGRKRLVAPIVAADEDTASILRYVLHKLGCPIFSKKDYLDDYNSIMKLRQTIDWPIGLMIDISEQELLFVANAFHTAFILNPKLAPLCWKVPVGIIKIIEPKDSLTLKDIHHAVLINILSAIRSKTYMQQIPYDLLAIDDPRLMVGFPLLPHSRYFLHNISLDVAEKITGIRPFKTGKEANLFLFGNL